MPRFWQKKEALILFNQFRRRLSSRFVLTIAASVAVSNQAARGGGVVDIFVQSTDAIPISVDVNQKDLRQVPGDIINNKGAYAGFANRPLAATIGIAGAKKSPAVEIGRHRTEVILNRYPHG
jgi:hypothetical protein